MVNPTIMANESRPLYKAVCASCGKQCEVPFKPSGDRPVYCRDCFRARSEGGGSAPKQGGGSAKPFTPRPASQGASRPASQGAVNPSDGLAAQVSAMNAKLDRLLSLVENTTSRAPRVSKSAGKKTLSKRKMSSRKK